MKKNSTRKLTLCAIMSALSVVLIYVSAVFPTGQMGFLGLASLMGVAAVVEAGVKGGLGVYVTSAVLGLLLVPSKTVALVYTVFFGWYPILKLLCEKVKNRVLEYGLKLLVFNAAAAVIIFLLSVTIIDMSRLGNSYVVLFALLNVVFLIFDFGVTQAISVYLNRIQPRMHTN